MNKKTLIIIVIILITIGLVCFQRRSVGKITSVHLKAFSTVTEIGSEAKGTETTIFNKDDKIWIGGNVILKREAELTFQVLDEEGNIVQGDVPGIKLKESGGFGMCCITPPQQTGYYNLKLFLNNKEVKTLSFQIVD